MLAFVICIGISFYIFNKPESLNPETLCLENQDVSKNYVVIIDKTDSWTSKTARKLERKIVEIKSNMLKGEKIHLYKLTSSVGESIKPLFSLCSPGSGEETSIFYEGTKVAQKRYDKLFDDPIRQLLIELKVPSEGKTSPIVETLATLFSNHYFEIRQTEFILFSDLRQNTKSFSVFKRGSNFDDFIDLADSSFVNLSGSVFQVHFIDHLKSKTSTEKEMRRIWSEAINRSNGRIFWNSL